MQEKNEAEKYASYFLLAAVLLGLALRLYKVDFQSLWLDELYSIVPTNPSNSASHVIEYSKGDQPPFFFLLLHFWFKISQYTEYSARIFSSIIGVFGIISIYFLGTELGGKQTGIFASFLLAVNHFHIHYSQDVRFYGLLFLMSSLSYLFFIRSLRNQNFSNVAFYTLTTAGLLYTHYFSFFILAAQAFTFVYVVFRENNLKLFLVGFTAFALVCFSYLPWFQVIFDDLYDVLPHIKQVDIFFVFKFLYNYYGKDAFTLTMLLGLFVFFLKSKYLADKRRELVVLIGAWMLITYSLPYIRSILVSPMIEYRYTIISFPAWMILFSLGWGALRTTRAKSIFLILILTSSMTNLFLMRRYYSKITKEQWREVSNYVIVKNSGNHPVISPLNWHFAFYFKDQPYPVVYFKADEMQRHSRFWFIVAHLPDEEMEAQIKTISTDFIPLERKDFYGAIAVLFENKRIH